MASAIVVQFLKICESLVRIDDSIVVVVKGVPNTMPPFSVLNVCTACAPHAHPFLPGAMAFCHMDLCFGGGMRVCWNFSLCPIKNNTNLVFSPDAAQNPSKANALLPCGRPSPREIFIPGLGGGWKEVKYRQRAMTNHFLGHQPATSNEGTVLICGGLR